MKSMIFQMAMEVIKTFPSVPQDMMFDTSAKAMSRKRLEMASEILKSSGMLV